MKKLGLIILVILGVLLIAFLIKPKTEPEIDTSKKLPGDAMTEQAVDDALTGKVPTPTNTQPTPKANDLQGNSPSGELRGDVIFENAP